VTGRTGRTGTGRLVEKQKGENAKGGRNSVMAMVSTFAPRAFYILPVLGPVLPVFPDFPVLPT